MNKAKSGTEERIVEAAVQLFSHRGFSGTSTREIARLADVNETSLFRYFPRKQDLFWAAMESRLCRVRLRRELQAGLEETSKPDVVFPLMFELFVQISAYHPELMALLYVGLLELRPGAEEMYREHLAPMFQSIHRYLERCIKAGTVRQVDPWIVTAALASTVLTDERMHTLTFGGRRPYSNAQEMASAYTQFWLNVLVEPGSSLAATVLKSIRPSAEGPKKESRP